MAPKARLEPLFDHDSKRFVQRVVHRDRRGMMIDAVGAPVLLDEREVEVPRGARRLALAYRFHRARAESHRRQPRRRTDSFLRAAVAGVNLPAVDLQRHASERRHSVGHHQRAVRVRHLRDFLDRLMNSGRSLGVHDRHQLGHLGRLQRLLDPLGFDDSAPLGVHLMDFRAEPRRDFDHPGAEHAGGADHHFIARLDQVRHHGLHPGRAGARDRESDLVGGAENQPQHLLDVVHHLDEVGIEMADHRRQHRLHHARMNVRGAGSEQHAGRRLQFRKRGTGQRRSPF